MKTVYNITTGAEVLAYEDPKVAGRYALPANSIEVAPPKFNATTHTCSFNGTEWIVTEIPQPEPEPEPEPYVETYADKRLKEYGSAQEQIEFITENGLDAWQTKVSEIKTKYPKPT